MFLLLRWVKTGQLLPFEPLLLEEELRVVFPVLLVLVFSEDTLGAALPRWFSLVLTCVLDLAGVLLRGAGVLTRWFCVGRCSTFVRLCELGTCPCLFGTAFSPAVFTLLLFSVRLTCRSLGLGWVDLWLFKFGFWTRVLGEFVPTLVEGLALVRLLVALSTC